MQKQEVARYLLNTEFRCMASKRWLFPLHSGEIEGKELMIFRKIQLVYLLILNIQIEITLIQNLFYSGKTQFLLITIQSPYLLT